MTGVPDEHFKKISIEHPNEDDPEDMMSGEIHIHYDTVIIYTNEHEKVYTLHPIWMLDMSDLSILIGDVMIVENGVMEATKVHYVLGGSQPNKSDEFTSHDTNKPFIAALRRWLCSLKHELAKTIAEVLDEQYVFISEITNFEGKLLGEKDA